MERTVNMTTARKDIYGIAKEVNEEHSLVRVFNGSTHNNIVILSEEDYNAMQETLYLHSVPGLVESILEAGSLPDSDFVDESEVEW